MQNAMADVREETWNTVKNVKEREIIYVYFLEGLKDIMEEVAFEVCVNR